MVLNYIWVGFFIVSFAVGLIRLILFYLNRGGLLDSPWLQKLASTGVFEVMVKSAFEMAKTAVMEIGLPMAGIMKPLSGGGARATMLDTMKQYGADSFAGRLSCMFQGAADTTFLIIAMYFGSVGIKKTRYAVAGGLIADFAGVIAAIIIAYIFFG